MNEMAGRLAPSVLLHPLGLLFPVLYFACGGVSVRNRFEQAADYYARTGIGWWPWPRPGA